MANGRAALSQARRRIKRGIGERIRTAVGFAGDMLDLEIVELPGHFRGAFVQRFQVCALHFVAPLHLPHEQFGVAADSKRANMMRGCIIQRCEQCKILSDVVRFTANFLCEICDDLPISIAHHNCIGRRPGIASRSAVNVRGMHASRRRGSMRV